VNKKVRIITTANDVIHSWTIPAFGVKQDAIPGLSAIPGSKQKKLVSIVVSAWSCAVKNMHSCLSL
jgi:cytochrome c oxidase subunit 2